MSVRATQPPAVPLRAAVGPEHPPCPACSNPLFPWVAEPWHDADPVLRCEECGMAVVGPAATAGEARDAARALGPVAPNRGGLAAWIGGGAWAPLQPGSRFLFTADALSRLLPDPRAPSPQAGMSIGLMWQTLQNSFTFGRNLALGRNGPLERTPAARPWQRGVDTVIVVVTAIPLLPVAAVMEIGAALAGRGGVLRAKRS